MRWNEHCIRPFPQNSSHEISGAHGETRLSRLNKRYRKEPQDISKRKRAILMPFHPTLNHDVFDHMEKIQPILTARFRVPPRSLFGSNSHSKLSARDGRRKVRTRKGPGNVLSVCDFLAEAAFDHHRNFYTTPARRRWSICLVSTRGDFTDRLAPSWPFFSR